RGGTGSGPAGRAFRVGRGRRAGRAAGRGRQGIHRHLARPSTVHRGRSGILPNPAGQLQGAKTRGVPRGAAPKPVRQGPQTPAQECDMTVSYERRDAVAIVTMNRPEYRNAQNSAMTYALDAAFVRAVDDDEVTVIVLAGAGKHFSAGHDIGTPGRDVDVSFERKAVLWWDHVGREGG